MTKKQQTIKLKGGAEVTVDWNSMSACKACGVKIYWSKTKNNKLMPINVCGIAEWGFHFVSGIAEWESHFVSCRYADKFRKISKKVS